MGEITDKLKGAGNKIAGTVKQDMGRRENDPDLEAQGTAQKLKGTGQDIKGSVKGALGDRV